MGKIRFKPACKPAWRLLNACSGALGEILSLMCPATSAHFVNLSLSLFFYNHKQLQLLNPKDFSSLFSPFGPEYLSIWVFIIFQAFKMQMCRSVNCGHQGCVRRTAFKCKWLLLLWTGIYLETKWGWTLKNGRSEWVGGGQIHCSILHPSSPAWWGGAGRGRRGCVNPRLLALGSCSVKEWVAASHRYTEHQKHLMLQTSWAGKKWNCLRSLCLLSSFVPR